MANEIQCESSRRSALDDWALSVIPEMRGAKCPAEEWCVRKIRKLDEMPGILSSHGSQVVSTEAGPSHFQCKDTRANFQRPMKEK